MECMEKLLSIKLKGQNEHHMLASKFVVQAKAHSVYEDLSKMDGNVKPLSASTGWFGRFLKRYNFRNIKMTEEPASADTVAVSLCEVRLSVL
jgi:hypothetical protein